MALTDTFVRQAKHSGSYPETNILTAAGCTRMSPAQASIGAWHTCFAGKQKKLSIGAYPTVSLAKAQKPHEEARELLADGKDLSERHQEKIAFQQPARHPTLFIMSA